MDPALALLALSRACVMMQRGTQARERIVCERTDDLWKGVAHIGPRGELSASYKDGTVLVSGPAGARHAFRSEHPQRMAVVRGADGEPDLVEVLDEAWVGRLCGVTVQLQECDELSFTVFDDPVKLFVFRSGGECILFQRRVMKPDVDGALERLDRDIRKPRQAVVRCMTQGEAHRHSLFSRVLFSSWTIIDYISFGGALVAFADGIHRGVWGYVLQALSSTRLIVICDGRKLTLNSAGQALMCPDQEPHSVIPCVWHGVVVWFK